MARPKGSKPQLAKMVRNMSLWLNDSQIVLADQMPVTNAAQTESERPAPGGNNSATGFATPARDINNLQTGWQNINVFLHFHGFLYRIIDAHFWICKLVRKLLMSGRGLANSSADGYPPGLRLALLACWMLLPHWQLKSTCRPGCGWVAGSISMPTA